MILIEIRWKYVNLMRKCMILMIKHKFIHFLHGYKGITCKMIKIYKNDDFNSKIPY